MRGFSLFFNWLPQLPNQNKPTIQVIKLFIGLRKNDWDLLTFHKGNQIKIHAKATEFS